MAMGLVLTTYISESPNKHREYGAADALLAAFCEIHRALRTVAIGDLWMRLRATPREAIEKQSKSKFGGRSQKFIIAEEERKNDRTTLGPRLTHSPSFADVTRPFPTKIDQPYYYSSLVLGKNPRDTHTGIRHCRLNRGEQEEMSQIKLEN